MRHFFSVVQTPSGTAVSGATVDVYNAGGTVHATIYSDDGVTTTTNPLTTASDGTFGFYVADGRYDLKVSGTGITTRTFSDVEIFDATEKNAADGTLTATAANFTTLTVTGNETIGGTLQVTGATTLNSGTLNGSFSGNPTFSGTPAFSTGASLAGTFSGNPTFSGNITAIAGQNSFNAFKFNSMLFVDGIKYTSIQAALNDLPSTGGCVCVPPNYAETLAANITISKKKTVLWFTGPAAITLGANNIQIQQGIDDVSIITPYAHSSDQGGNNQGVMFLGYTGAGAAIDIGSSAGFTYNTLLRGFAVDLFSAQANAIGIRRTNGVAGPLEYINVIGGPVSGQIGFQFVGTGALFDGTSNLVGLELNYSASATNGKGVQFTGVNQNGYSFLGGHANMGGSTNGSVAIDIGAGTSKVDLGGFYADVAATAVTVESTTNTAVRGWLIVDSGVTLVANFAAGSNGNRIETNTRSIGTQLVTDNGTAATNSVTNGFDMQWNSRRWRVISEAGGSGFQLIDQSDGSQALAKGVTGATHMDSSAGNPVRFCQNTGAGFEFWDNTAVTFGGSSAGVVTTYKKIATVSNGIPSEVATVDSTGLTAAVGTTTLYAVPATGAGQYRLCWDAKVTTAAGTSSTLGALTIVYTDPDGNAITITAGALQIGGTIATTVTTNSVTTAALYGIPLFLNCKASTNITYAMAYASNAANAMAYNLHLKLEAL